MTQATTVMPRAAEMPKTVLTPTTCEFFAEIRKKFVRTAKFVKKYKEKE
jgi:hypothetical protein